MLSPVEDVDAVAFAANLALVITMRRSQHIGGEVRETMKLVTDSCKDTGLQLVQEKSLRLQGSMETEDFKVRREWWRDRYQKYSKIFGGAVGQRQEVFPTSGAGVRQGGEVCGSHQEPAA